jgi:hypothetical protein
MSEMVYSMPKQGIREKDFISTQSTIQQKAPKPDQVSVPNTRHGLEHNFGKVQVGEAPNLVRPTLVRAAEFLGFTQGEYMSCGAASIVSALMIWDRERRNQTPPNNLLVTSCNLILIDLINRKDYLKRFWIEHGIDGDKLFNEIYSTVTSVRDVGLRPDSVISENDYKMLGTALYILFKPDPDTEKAGLPSSRSDELLRTIGLKKETTLGESSKNDNSTMIAGFDDIFASVSDLLPGEIVQVTWLSRQKHAFLIGRFQRGPWFLADQGTAPPTEIESTSLDGLRRAIIEKVKSGYRLYTGELTEAQKFGFGILEIKRLGSPAGVEEKAANLIMRGAFLAEVDASIIGFGDKIYAKAFHSRHYDLAIAQTATDIPDAGGVIVEMPEGVFNVYVTNLVSDTNLNMKSIDESDSRDGLLSGHRYFSAWLRLRSKHSSTQSCFKVY